MAVLRRAPPCTLCSFHGTREHGKREASAPQAQLSRPHLVVIEDPQHAVLRVTTHMCMSASAVAHTPLARPTASSHGWPTWLPKWAFTAASMSAKLTTLT